MTIAKDCVDPSACVGGLYVAIAAITRGVLTMMTAVNGRGVIITGASFHYLVSRAVHFLADCMSI